MNPYHVLAALNAAADLEDRNGLDSFEIFHQALGAMRNIEKISAPDLAVAWYPGEKVWLHVVKVLLGHVGSDVGLKARDEATAKMIVELSQKYLTSAQKANRWDIAEEALATFESIGGTNLECSWARIEIEWRRGSLLWIDLLAQMCEQGSFLDPRDPIEWAERSQEIGELNLAEACLVWAKSWLPEYPKTWRVSAKTKKALGKMEEARRHLERALTLDPGDIHAFIMWLCLKEDSGIGLEPSSEMSISLDISGDTGLGSEFEVICFVKGASLEGRIYLIPPTGWGLVPLENNKGIQSSEARFNVLAARPDRINKGPWLLQAIVVDQGCYAATTCEVNVNDPTPGNILVAVTEDHEFQEERGELLVDDLKALFLDKARLTASLGVPITRMVEVGSAIKTLRWAENTSLDSRWGDLQREVECELADEVIRGLDVQPHLHAFNDPEFDHFPYGVLSDRLVLSDKFLNTSWNLRGDWASVSSPPERNLKSKTDRLASAERTISEVERIGYLSDPDYAALVWRSGLLEFGEDPVSRLWSTVALLRAGLLADSDVLAPSEDSLFKKQASGFAASWNDPFQEGANGPILQLPIAQNLEGSYMSSARTLARRVRQLIDNERDSGVIRPGVHVFTLLTHDKLINSRHGRDVDSLDARYGDWPVILDHIDTWKAEGARFATARESVLALASDLLFRPSALLRGLTYIVSPKGLTGIKFMLCTTGAKPNTNSLHPIHLMAVIPPVFREFIDGVRVITQNGHGESEIDEKPVELGSDRIWVQVGNVSYPISCFFSLNGKQDLLTSDWKQIKEGSEVVVTLEAKIAKARVEVLIGQNDLANAGLLGDLAVCNETDTLVPSEQVAEGLRIGPLELAGSNKNNKSMCKLIVRQADSRNIKAL